MCSGCEGSTGLVAMAIRELGLSARAYFKILKIARTIADLAEAIQYRAPGRNRAERGLV